MTREELQRQEELLYAARFFQRRFGYVPEFESLPTNSQPDVCAKFEGKRIGMELTRAVDDDQAVYDSFAEDMLEAARVRHAELDGLPGMAMVSLLPGFSTRGIYGKTLGVDLGQDVAKCWTDPTETTVIQSKQLSPSLARIVRQVTAFSVDGAQSTHWQAPMATRVQGITADVIQPIIDRKARKLHLYERMGCDELWLLIYARPRSAEMFDEATGFHRSQLSSPFGRTFFYDPWRIHELTPEA